MNRSARKHCLRRDEGMGSRSQKVLELILILNTSAVVGLKKLRLVGVSEVGGDGRL